MDVAGKRYKGAIPEGYCAVSSVEIRKGYPPRAGCPRRRRSAIEGWL